MDGLKPSVHGHICLRSCRSLASNGLELGRSEAKHVEAPIPPALHRRLRLLTTLVAVREGALPRRVQVSGIGSWEVLPRGKICIFILLAQPTTGEHCESLDSRVRHAFRCAASCALLAAEAFGTVRVEWDQVGGASVAEAFGGMQVA